MILSTILPPVDRASGFWAASERNGYEPRALWLMASDALAATFALTPVEVRDLLGGPVGRLLADDIKFIEGGPTDAEAIGTLLQERLRHLGWQRLYAQAIAEIRARHATRPDPGPEASSGSRSLPAAFRNRD
jgi:hypothetical protein